MPTTTPVHDIELIIENVGGGGTGKPPAGGDDGNSGGGENKKSPKPTPPNARRYYTGMALGIVSILMFFMALASAFLVRRGTSSDWTPVHLPPILWLNTVVLLASSASMEFAHRRLAHTDVSGFRKLWIITTGLGVCFLAGQLVAWKELANQGVFIASNPASSFFYVFTAAHAVHLFGGIGALFFVSVRKFERARISLSAASEIVSYYWHFMDALWVFLLALLYLGK
jgi:cytochrome c oxidase subunit 3